MVLSKRSIAYHEAAHAVAHYFYPLAGETQRIVVGKDKLAEHNAGKHPVNEALGLHISGKTLSAIVGRSVDREQIRHEGVGLLSGYAADWIFAGERGVSPKSDPVVDAEGQKHADGSDDVSRCFLLISNADPLDTRDVARQIHRENSATAEEEGRRAVEAYTAQCLERFDALWRESLAFVASKWPHVQAVAEAALRKGVLEADEITKRIERIEERLRTFPPQMREVLGGQRT
jgi:hypothetical protein